MHKFKFELNDIVVVICNDGVRPQSILGRIEGRRADTENKYRILLIYTTPSSEDKKHYLEYFESKIMTPKESFENNLRDI